MEGSLLTITPPILVWEPGTLDIFPSTAAAEAYVEPIDAEDSAFEAFDAEGYRLSFVIVSRPEQPRARWWWRNAARERIKLVHGDPPVRDPEGLRRVVVAGLRARGFPEDPGLATSQVADLVTGAITHLGLTGATE